MIFYSDVHNQNYAHTNPDVRNHEQSRTTSARPLLLSSNGLVHYLYRGSKKKACYTSTYQREVRFDSELGRPPVTGLRPRV